MKSESAGAIARRIAPRRRRAHDLSLCHRSWSGGRRRRSISATAIRWRRTPAAARRSPPRAGPPSRRRRPRCERPRQNKPDPNLAWCKYDLGRTKPIRLRRRKNPAISTRTTRLSWPAIPPRRRQAAAGFAGDMPWPVSSRAPRPAPDTFGACAAGLRGNDSDLARL